MFDKVYGQSTNRQNKASYVEKTGTQTFHRIIGYLMKLFIERFIYNVVIASPVKA